MITAYLAPDMPDSARQLLDSCQECQPDRGPTGPDRTRQCLTVPTGLTAKAQRETLAYTKFTRDSFRDLGAFWKRRDSRVNWVRFEAGRDSQREFTRLHLRITVTMRYIFKYESRQMSRKPRIWVKFADSSLISLILTFPRRIPGFTCVFGEICLRSSS